MWNIEIKNWWILTIKGLLTLTFGLIALTMPVKTLMYIVNFFGILLLISGILFVLTAIIRDVRKDRTWILTEGFLDIVIATIVLSFPEFTVSIFIAIVTIWISFMGILQISNAYRFRSLYNHWWFLILNGLLAIIFALFIFTQPIHGIVTLVVLIGLQAVVFGGFLIVSSFYIKRLLEDIHIDIPQKEGDEGNQELSYY